VYDSDVYDWLVAQPSKADFHTSVDFEIAKSSNEEIMSRGHTPRGRGGFSSPGNRGRGGSNTSL